MNKPQTPGNENKNEKSLPKYDSFMSCLKDSKMIETFNAILSQERGRLAHRITSLASDSQEEIIKESQKGR